MTDADTTRFTLPDGRVLRVMNNSILVERIPLSKMTSSGLYIPNPEKEDATAVGIVRAVGHHRTKRGGNLVPIDGVEPGMYCAFLWFYAEHHSNKSIQKQIGDNFVFLKWEDISLVWPADEEHTVSNLRSS